MRVLVTGANKGIGRATVEAILAANGDAEVWLGSRDRGRGAAARDEIVAAHPDWGQRVHVVQIDVGDADSVESAARTIAAGYDEERPLYGLVNNAGVGFGVDSAKPVLNVNTLGPRRVCNAFIGLLRRGGRIVNVSSAAGPSFVATCTPEQQALLTSPDVTWAQIDGLMNEYLNADEAQLAAMPQGWAYGFSKACLNAYTIVLARERPDLVVNACTPGFIETDLTRPFSEARGKTPAEMGMLSPEKGTRATLHLLFGEPGGSGWFFGSDAERSPLDRYRSPGDPPYTGD